MVRVKLFANLREAANGQRLVECPLDGPVSSVELLGTLAAQYGEKAQRLLFDKQGGVWQSIVIMRNGEMVRDRDAKVITPGDEVAVLLP
ncbi:MAG: MoaD/ThiS family protein, partial [Armatimonadetes bacterium]|nr:MoaD/ThiS family protein [Armatimonadota bacterium]